eukprot:6007016-Pleurochrysis_carterae.AAC.2
MPMLFVRLGRRNELLSQPFGWRYHDGALLKSVVHKLPVAQQPGVLTAQLETYCATVFIFYRDWNHIPSSLQNPSIMSEFLSCSVTLAFLYMHD